MSNLKGKVSLFLVMIMMMTAILPIFTVNAAEDVNMSVVVKYNGKQLSDRQSLTLEPGSKINVEVVTPYTEGLEIAYYWNAGKINTLPLGQIC